VRFVVRQRSLCQFVSLPLFVMGAVALVSEPRVLAGEPSLLTEARLGHRALRESIRSLSAEFTYQMTEPKPKIMASGKYWRSQQMVRIQTGQEGSLIDDHIVKGSEIRSVGRHWQNNSIKYAIMLRPNTELISPNDIWRLGLLRMTGPNGPVDMDGLLDAANSTPRATRVTEKGQDCIRVELEYTRNGEEKEIALWYDIKRNYLVRKMVTGRKGSSHRTVVEVQEFIEPVSGISFPKSRTCQNLENGRLEDSNLLTLDNIKINIDIPDQVFEPPPIPSGCILHDHVTETEYPVDANWQKIGPARRAPRIAVPDVAPPSSQTAYSTSSTDEPTPLGWRVLMGSVAALGVLALIAAIRFGWRQLRPVAREVS